jgi:two-component system OmpR family response regulator
MERLTAGRDRVDGPARPRVLVVEDDDAIRGLLEDLLEIEGYDVRAAADGTAGLAILRQWRPDAIVLDVVMPDGGASAFRAGQRGLAEAEDVPVLLVSATRVADLGCIARDLGATDWLAKPFDLDTLASAVARLVAGGGPTASPPR